MIKRLGFCFSDSVLIQWFNVILVAYMAQLCSSSPFASRWVCGWGATFAFYMRAFVALRLMSRARVSSFANGRLAESPDIRL